MSHFFLTNGFLAFSVIDRYQLDYFPYQPLQCTANYLITFLSFCCVIISLYAMSCVVFPVTISAYKRCSVRRYHQLFVGVSMSLLHYMCLLGHGGVQYILCFVFLSFVYLMLPFSLDCPLLIASSVFSNVYLNNNY